MFIELLGGKVFAAGSRAVICSRGLGVIVLRVKHDCPFSGVVSLSLTVAG